MVEDKEDLIDAMRGIDYNTKVLFTVNGVEHEAEVQIYGGEDSPQVIEICLNPKEELKVKDSFNNISNSTISLNPIDINDK